MLNLLSSIMNFYETLYFLFLTVLKFTQYPSFKSKHRYQFKDYSLDFQGSKALKHQIDHKITF